MDNVQWKELHGIEQDKDVYLALSNVDFGFLINDHVDYVVIIDITIYADGTRDIEVVGQLINIFNDDGDIINSINVSLPSKYEEQAVQKAKDREYL